MEEDYSSSALWEEWETFTLIGTMKKDPYEGFKTGSYINFERAKDTINDIFDLSRMIGVIPSFSAVIDNNCRYYPNDCKIELYFYNNFTKSTINNMDEFYEIICDYFLLWDWKMEKKIKNS